MSDTPAADVSAPAVRQGDLCEDLGPTVDGGFTTGRRIELDQTSWIEHAPGWLRDSGGLFDELMATATRPAGTETPSARSRKPASCVPRVPPSP